MSGFEPLGETLNRAFRRGPIRPVVLALNVERAAGALLPSWARMASFSASGRREGRLIIATPSPTHSQEIYLQSKELVEEINKELGREIVEQIKLKVG